MGRKCWNCRVPGIRRLEMHPHCKSIDNRMATPLDFSKLKIPFRRHLPEWIIRWIAIAVWTCCATDRLCSRRHFQNGGARIRDRKSCGWATNSIVWHWQIGTNFSRMCRSMDGIGRADAIRRSSRERKWRPTVRAAGWRPYCVRNRIRRRNSGRRRRFRRRRPISGRRMRPWLPFGPNSHPSTRNWWKFRRKRRKISCGLEKIKFIVGFRLTPKWTDGDSVELNRSD